LLSKIDISQNCIDCKHITDIKICECSRDSTNSEKC